MALVVKLGHTWGVRISQKALGRFPLSREIDTISHTNVQSPRGRLVQDRSTKEPKLNCRNWECGVVIPIIQQGTKVEGRSLGNVSKEKSSDERKNEKEFDFAPLFDAKVPVPMKLPGRPYGPEMKPWYYMED